MPVLSKSAAIVSATLAACLALSPIATCAQTASTPALQDQAITDALSYFGMIRGEPIGSADVAWMKEQWAREYAVAPADVSAQIEVLAYGYKRDQLSVDPMALAIARNAMINNVYCAAEQSSRHDVQRLRSILAPDDLVVAADCKFGLVATRFDVDGLVSSNGLAAEIASVSHDPNVDRSEILDWFGSNFDSADPAVKAMLANGGLRHAMLQRFWSRIDGSPEQAAVAEEIRNKAANDLRPAARNLEQLAVEKLGEVDYLAAAGSSRLTADAINAYVTWLEWIAGHDLAASDRAWLQDAAIRGFKDDPEKALGEIAGIRQAIQDYRLARSEEDKRTLVAHWAAGLHCHIERSSDPDEQQLGEFVFEWNPVIDADCSSNAITRRLDTQLAEASGQALTEGQLRPSFEFLSMLLGRSLLTEEETFVRQDSIRTFMEDPAAWHAENEQYLQVLTKFKRNRTSSFFISIDARKKLFDPIYCSLKQSEDPASATYLAMFQRNDAIVFEDCNRTLVTTQDELDAAVGGLNFLSLLNDMPPFTVEEETSIIKASKEYDLNGSESDLAALKEWWSLLSLDEKAQQIAYVRDNGITPEADSARLTSFVDLAKAEVFTINLKREQCELMAVIAKGQTAIFAAKAGRSMFERDPMWSLGVEYGNIVTNTNMFAEICA